MIEEVAEEGSQEKVGWTIIPRTGEDLRNVEITAKRAVVGAGARVLFYPTLLYNVVRNKLQPEFQWWDQIDQVYLVGSSCTLSSSKRLVVHVVWCVDVICVRIV